VWVLSPDGRTLTDGSVVWDLDSGQKTDRDIDKYADTAASRLDCRTTAFAHYGDVTVADTPSGHKIASFTVASGMGGGDVVSIALSPDNRSLAVAIGDNTVQLWDISSGRQTGSTLTGLTKPATALTFSPDGRILAAAGRDGTALAWDTASQRQFGDPLTGVNAIAFSPDNQTLATGGIDHTIRLWTLPPR
jgi:WD40 repeat protein